MYGSRICLALLLQWAAVMDRARSFDDLDGTHWYHENMWLWLLVAGSKAERWGVQVGKRRGIGLCLWYLDLIACGVFVASP